MSRRITIKTQMHNPEVIAETLNELGATYTRTKDRFDVSRVKDKTFRYTGVFFADGETGYDEDDPEAQKWATETFVQYYSKNLKLDQALQHGEIIDQHFFATQDNMVIDGVDSGMIHNVIEEGDYVIVGWTSF